MLTKYSIYVPDGRIEQLRATRIAFEGGGVQLYHWTELIRAYAPQAWLRARQEPVEPAPGSVQK